MSWLGQEIVREQYRFSKSWKSQVLLYRDTKLSALSNSFSLYFRPGLRFWVGSSSLVY